MMPITPMKQFALLAIIAGFFLQSCSTAPDPEATAQVPESFTKLCASCHGDDLKGNIAQSLLDGSWQFGSRRSDIMRSVKFGYPHHGMPSWGAVLTDVEIDTLVGFLLKEEERLGVTKPPIPTTIETQDYIVQVEVMGQGLDNPWSIAFVSNDKALVTEKSGRLRIVENGSLLPDSIVGIGTQEWSREGLLDASLRS
ncbi:MAG: c-type cytochrome [Saprospiraceae bacterium]|nr:c-type cytochrome [Saprospiraceae bacterium]